MRGKAVHREFSRRAVGCHLAFCLGTLGWLVAGIAVVTKTAVERRDQPARLAGLSQAAAAIRSAADCEDDSLQEMLEDLRSRWGMAYCGILWPDGRFLARGRPEQAGRRAERRTAGGPDGPQGPTTRPVRQSRSGVREYQIPIARDGRALVMGMADGGAWQAARQGAKYVPAGIVCPMLLMLIGGIRLHRAVRPMAEMEGQLRGLATAPCVSPEALEPVTAPSPSAIGWNRMVESLRNGGSGGSLESRVRHALEGYRQQRLEQILNSLPEGIAVTDENGTITFANQSLGALLAGGASDASLCGKTMEACLAAEGAGPAAGPLLDANLRGRTVVVELGRGGDMSQGVLRVARSPLRLPGGESNSSQVWSVRDITQQKLADQMRDQFVNAATHELRTPMANIKAYAETLALSEVSDVEQQKEFCNIINEEVTRLARFVDDLLHLSRMEVGATSLRRQVTDMERLLQETVNKVRSQMEQKNLSFDVELPEKLPELLLDKDKIIVALVNLLGNAVKYTPEGGRVRFHVEVNDSTMEIDVEDTGIGISVEELPKVLDKFFRSSDPRVRERTGSGLGLSLSNEIIRLHGGKLSVHSELNKGSKFTVIIPASPEAVRCSSGSNKVRST